MVAKLCAKQRKKIPPEQMLTYVERRLDEWAHWFSRGNLYGLGYPPCAIEYRLMKGEMVKHDYMHQPSVPVNENAEEMEQFVQEMALQNPEMALALREHYFNRYSLRKQAKEAGISHTQLKFLVDMGKQWMVGRMSSEWVE